MSKAITGTVNITGYTPYTDDIIADDALFNIFSGARLVLTGNDQFVDDTIAGQGQWRIDGPLDIDQVTIEDNVFTANNSIVTQSGFVTMGRAASDDLAIIRNLPGATWDITADVAIGPSADVSRFVNLGLFEKTGGGGVSGVASIFNSIGTVNVASGELQFTGGRARFSGTVEGAGAIDVTTRAILDGVDMSSANFAADLAIVRDDAVVSSAFAANTVVLQNGKLELTGDGSVLPGVVKGSGAIVVEGQAQFDGLTLYQHTELDNAGTLTVGDGETKNIGFKVVPAASGVLPEVNNLAGATFVWDCVALSSDDLLRVHSGLSSAFEGWTNNGPLSPSPVNNEGTVLQAAGWLTTDLLFNNDGIVEVGGAGGADFSAVKVYRNDVAGSGTMRIEAGGADIFASAVAASQTVAFDPSLGSTSPLALGIGDLADFHAAIAGFGSGSEPETISVADWSFDGFSYAGGSGVVNGLVFERDGQIASLALKDPLDTSNVSIHAGSGGTGTVITYS